MSKEYRFRPGAARRYSVDFSLPVVTKQTHKAECDIYTIMSQYQRTGVISHMAAVRPYFGDLPDAVDYQGALELVAAARDRFADLPAVVRDRYGNDPARFLSALEGRADDEFLRSAGVLDAGPAPGPGAGGGGQRSPSRADEGSGGPPVAS